MDHSADHAHEHDRRGDPLMALPLIMFALLGATLAGVLGITESSSAAIGAASAAAVFAAVVIAI